MKTALVSTACFFTLCLGLCLTPIAAIAEDNSAVEAKFVASLKNATLKGSWAPVQGGALGTEKGNDRYRVARVEKKSDDQWSLYSVINVRGQEIEFPIAVTVKFAGDVAVLFLDNVKAGPGKANWSARVMFHDDVYTGRWWETSNLEHGGTIAGTITRAE